MKISDTLLDGSSFLGVWGLGHIGFSTARYFAEAGVPVRGYDPNSNCVAERRAADLPGTRFATSSAILLRPEVPVHMIAVPTERDGEPYLGALEDVTRKIAGAAAAGCWRGEAPLMIIESTLTPGTIDTFIVPIISSYGLRAGSDILIAVAPRRDWFLGPGFQFATLDRIYGGYGPRSSELAGAVLSLVNRTLHHAPSHREAELVKCVENAYRHLDITFANQLTLAYPGIDIVEVLRLAGTKWNIHTFHPSFGTGGYCIPLSSRYLIQGAERPESLSLLSATIDTDDLMRTLVADAVAETGPVVVLGLACRGAVKVDVHSPTKGIADRLRRLGVRFTVFDPLYSPWEVERILGEGTSEPNILESLRRARSVLVVTDHQEFVDHPAYVLAMNADRTERLTIIDNHGTLAAVDWESHVYYQRAGSANWLNSVVPEVDSVDTPGFV
ncbi:UDP binding domain-containing protein [Nocardia sp. NPDC005978]|uniref:UDP binding domain-containing protein n=1 Tax=Nocardia sp. NPDC005978 TaxID=3156725 RepID=UPI0033A4DC4D